MDLSSADLFVAVLAVLAGWWLGVRSERLSASQYKLSAASFASDWFRGLRSWASEAIDVLSESAYLAPGQNDDRAIDETRARDCRSRLSALIDRGRFYIPNSAHDKWGTDKPLAFRGSRHPALDFLVAAERVLAGTEPEIHKFPSQRSALVEIKRAFVSEIQDLLDPRAQNKAIAELLRLSQGDSASIQTAFQRLAQHPRRSDKSN